MKKYQYQELQKVYQEMPEFNKWYEQREVIRNWEKKIGQFCFKIKYILL